MDARARRFVALSGVFACLITTTLAQTPTQPPAGGGPRPTTAGQPPARDAAPPTGSGLIRGRVVTAENGSPLRRVQIRLAGGAFSSTTAPSAVSDAQGRYELKNLPAGRFTLAASKNGYLSLSYGQRRPRESARPIDLAAGQTLENVDFSLPHGAVITVRIVDEFGEPVSGAGVSVQQYGVSAGRRRLTGVPAGSPGLNQTDDRGEIRLSGLPPGEFFVSSGGALGTPALLGASDSNRIYGTTYYPGTTSIAEAQRVAVGVGQEASITIPMVPVRVSSLSGTVRSSDDRPFTGISARAVLRADAGPAVGVAGEVGAIQSDGTFTIRNLLPGDYSLLVSPDIGALGRGVQEFVELPMSVAGADVTGISLTTSKGATLRGRFVFDTGEPPKLPPTLFGIRPLLDPQIGLGATTVNDDWTFSIANVFGTGTLRLASSGLPATNGISGWFLEAVKLGEEDVTDARLELRGDREIGPFQMILTQKRTSISGTVVDAKNAAVSDYVALVFSEDRKRWEALTGWAPYTRFVATGRPDQQGRFIIRDLPPGRYLAAAVDYLETGEEGDVELLGRLAEKAVTVTLGEGAAETLGNLTLTVR